MPESLNLYLDQMFRLDVAQALRNEKHNVVRASEVGQDRADDRQILGRINSRPLSACPTISGLR